jgi:GTP cyclohydrolase I
MARCQSHPAPLRQVVLEPVQHHSLQCDGPAHVAYHSRRTVVTLDGLCRFLLAVRRC